MAELIYALCALTSALCAVLLTRSYVRQHAPLLLWSALCFGGLTVSSVLVFVDKVVLPASDFSLVRAGVSAVSMAVLAVALVWSSRER